METVPSPSYDFLDSSDYSPDVQRAKNIIKDYNFDNDIFSFSLFTLHMPLDDDPNLKWLTEVMFDNLQIRQLIWDLIDKHNKIPGLIDLNLELLSFFIGQHEDRYGDVITALQENKPIKFETEEENRHDYYLALKLFRKRFDKLLHQYNLL